MNTYSRRNFLRTSTDWRSCITCVKPFNTLASFGKPEQFSASAAITSGDNRADLAFRALKPFQNR